MVTIFSISSLLVFATAAMAVKKEIKHKIGHSAFAKDIDWTLVKYDPDTADTVEDAAWNCIVDFNEIEPHWVCDMTRGTEQKYADMCTPNGNVQLMRTLVYPFCKLRTQVKPEKRPYLKKSHGPVSVYNVDVDVNIDGNELTSDTTVTVTASGHPVIVNIDAGDLAVSAPSKQDSTTTNQKIQTVTVTETYSAGTGFRTITVTP